MLFVEIDSSQIINADLIANSVNAITFWSVQLQILKHELLLYLKQGVLNHLRSDYVL